MISLAVVTRGVPVAGAVIDGVRGSGAVCCGNRGASVESDTGTSVDEEGRGSKT